MKAILITCLMFVSVSTAGAIGISDPNVNLSEQQQENISALLDILVAVYDNDASLIPNEPNGILVLETSENPRDLLAWQIFKMLRHELDPNSISIERETSVVSDEFAAEIVPNGNSAMNINCQSLTSTGEMAVNSSGFEEDNIIPANTYLSGENYWSGVYRLQGPVYVYSTEPNGLVVPASLTIVPGSQIIADANEVGIFLAGGSSFKATYASFEPNFISADYWQGIDINGEPGEFEFKNCEIRAAYCGINVWRARSVDIHDCLFKWCLDGVKSKYSIIHITNSVFDDTYGNAIEYWMQDPNLPDSEGAYKTLTVDNCTITGSWYDTEYGPFAQDYGITVHGAESSQNVASVHIANTLITSSWISAVNFVDGWCSASLLNNGYFQNQAIYNEDCPFQDVNPAILSFDPFQETIYNGYGQWDMSYLVNEDCPLIDAGTDSIFDSCLIGKTCTGEVPDSNMLDIGYHYPLDSYFDEGYAPKADFNQDGIVNYIDFQVMSRSWLCYFDPNIPTDPNDPNSPYDPNNLYDPNTPDDPNDPNVPGNPYEPNSIADLSGDGYVNAADLILFADEWLLESTVDAGKGRIDVVYSKPVGDISGWLEMTVAVHNPVATVFEIHLFLDGKDIGNIDYPDDRPLVIATDEYPNGPHTLQFFAFMDNGDYIMSHKHEVIFNNAIGILSNAGYSTKRGLRLDLNLQSGQTYRVGIYDILTDTDPNGVAIFETTCTSDTTSITVPKEVFSEGMPIYNVRVQVVEPNEPTEPNVVFAMASGDSLETEVQKIISQEVRDAWENLCDGVIYDTVVSIGSDGLLGTQKEIYTSWIRETWRDIKSTDKKILFISPTSRDSLYSEKDTYYNFWTIGLFLKRPDSKGTAIRWYHCGHGFKDLLGERPRTGVMIGNQKVFTELWSDYTDENRPGDLQKLIRHENCMSLRKYGCYNGGYLTYVIFDGCSTVADDKAAKSLGILGPNLPAGGSFLWGWKDAIPENENQLTLPRFGEYNTYRKNLAISLNAKVDFDSAKEICARDLTYGHDMRDNLIGYGILWQYAHWNTPNIQEHHDTR